MNKAVAEALEYYGFGRAELPETCFVFGFVKFTGELVVSCGILSRHDKGTAPIPCEFLRSEIDLTFTDTDTAMIEIPKCYLPIFCLWDAVLDEKKIAACRSLAEIHKAISMRVCDERPAEVIAGIRI